MNIKEHTSTFSTSGLKTVYTATQKCILNFVEVSTGSNTTDFNLIIDDARISEELSVSANTTKNLFSGKIVLDTGHIIKVYGSNGYGIRIQLVEGVK